MKSLEIKSINLWGMIAVVIYFLININAYNPPQENSAPTVKISKPVDQSEFKWNSIVPFSIMVSDQEDGESAYEEINVNEVLLEITYFSGDAQIDQYLVEGTKERRAGLRSLSKSNCLTCHAARSKLIGPSFEKIAGKYVGKPESVEALIHKITIGSKGVWGKVLMPPHPDLSSERIREMVKWILDFDSVENYTFYVGIEGSFKTRAKASGESTGTYVLTASYLDHGTSGIPETGKEGLDTVTLLGQ